MVRSGRYGKTIAILEKNNSISHAGLRAGIYNTLRKEALHLMRKMRQETISYQADMYDL